MQKNQRLMMETRKRLKERRSRRGSPWRWTGVFLVIVAVLSFLFSLWPIWLVALFFSLVAFELERRQTMD